MGNEITIRARKTTRPKLRFNGLAAASFGRSPKLSDDTEDATWLVFDDETMEYVDTGIRAEGENGKSAYDLAVEQGFEGTLEEWLQSLKGESITAELTETEDGVELTVTDKDGPKTALIPKGKEGPPGSDASVTEDNIRAALGYTPGNATDVAALQELVPPQASAENQLADKEFVNSSVATNTANYISKDGLPFNSFAELEAYAGTLTNNDYAFVVGMDEAGNVVYTRYKWNADTGEWAEEYKLNNSSFTAAQWAAIQSGITGELVEKIGDNETAIGQLETAVAGKAEDADVYHEYRLIFDGETIKKDGETQTFAQVYEAVNDKSKFVYIVYLNRLYIPQYHDSGLVSFSCSYLDGTTPTIRRIRIAASGAITTATETMYNKGQVDASLTEIKEDLAQLQNTWDDPAPAGKVWTATEEGAGWADPKGGGGRSEKWEFILSGTTSEDTDVVRFWQNLGGKYSKVFLRLDLGAAINLNIYARFNVADRTGITYAFGQTANTRFRTIELEYIDRRYVVGKMLAQTSSTATGTFASGLSEMQTKGYTEYFGFYCSSGAIPVGTLFEIWGVKYDA